MFVAIVRSVPASLLLVAALHAQGFKLNPPLAQLPGTGGDIESFQVVAGGARVVYLGDQDDDDIIELYSVAADGSQAAVELSAITQSSGFAFPYLVSADGSRVAYSVRQDVADPFHHLYGVPADGSSPAVRLDPDQPPRAFTLTSDGARVVFGADGAHVLVRASDASSPALTLAGPYSEVRDVKLTSDDTRVVFQASQGTASALYSVPIDGSASPVTLAIDLPNPASFELAPDGSRVVFQSSGAVHSVPTAGGTRVQLSGPAVPAGAANPFAIDPTSARVVYRADQLVDNRFELFSAPIDGSQPAVRVNADLVAGGDVQFDFAVSLDGTRALYVADQEVDGRFELFAVPIDGSGAPVKLSGPLVPGGIVHAARVAADGVHAVYRADQDVAGRIELYAAPLDGSAPAIKLNGSFAPGASGVSDVSLGASGVLYVADQDVAGQFELHRAPYDGSAPAQRLSGPMANGGDVSLFMTPVEAGGRAFYGADQARDDAFEVFAAPLDASAPAHALNEPLAPGTVIGNVFSAAIARSTPPRYVYLADQDQYATLELYSTSLEGEPRNVKLSHPLPLGSVEYFLVAPDGSRVVYRATESGVRHVYSVPSDASQAAVRLSGPFVPGGSAGTLNGPIDFAISPDGTHVVYRADQDVDEVRELYGAPIDGSAPAVKLSGVIAPGGVVREFQFSPDGTRVLFRAAKTSGPVNELYCAPIDGSQPPIALTPGQNFSQVWYAFSPDGSTVLYVDDRDTATVLELYRVPSTGGPTVKLNGALVTGGDVKEWANHDSPFAISADSSRVVYLADQMTDEVFELFSVPFDGSASPVRLNPALSGLRDAQSFAITPDSARVVFLADLTNDVHEIFSAPLDGSAAAVRLNGAMPATGDVADALQPGLPLRITPDGERVVYRSDELVDEHQDLFAAPVDGSAPPVRLNGAGPVGVLRWFELTDDGRDVVYLSAGLFSAALDGAGPQRRMEGPGQFAYSDEALFRFDVGARQVIFRARESGADVHELFLSLIPRPHRSSGSPARSTTRTTD